MYGFEVVIAAYYFEVSIMLVRIFFVNCLYGIEVAI